MSGTERMGEILKYNEEDLGDVAVSMAARQGLRFRSLRLAHPTRHRVRAFKSADC